MLAKIHRALELEEYWFHEGCHILEIANHPDDPAVSIARARVAPGQQTSWHHLNGVIERYLIIEGTAVVEVGNDKPTVVGCGDVIIIPAGIRQRIRNCADGDLMFYAICSPRFTPECYHSR